MRTMLATLLAITAMLSPQIAATQTPDNAATTPAATPDQIAAIRTRLAGRSPATILSIAGTTRVDDEVIFVDTLRFDDGATMMLKADGRDAIIIAAREIRMSGPEFKGTIAFGDRAPANGAPGAAPPPAPAKLGRSGDNGAAGAAGIAGARGADGGTRRLPTVYIVTTDIRRSTGGQPDFTDLRIAADGIDGGEGGRGGAGQDGQPGQDGRHGETKYRVCSKGPRSGGRGGDGGPPGEGGAGGAGGPGGDIVFLVPAQAQEAVRDIRIRNRGGLGGVGGLIGVPGNGAPGGARGARPGNCGGASSGDGGSTPAPAPAGTRNPQAGAEGARGTIAVLPATAVADLFPAR